MPKIGDMIESKYLKESDVGEEGRVLTIKGVKRQNVAKQDEDAEYKWTMEFEEVKKPMILNTTNLKRLAQVLRSEDSDDWIGKQVVIWFNPDIEMRGERVGGLRVRPAPPAGARRPNDAGTAPRDNVDDFKDDIPF